MEISESIILDIINAYQELEYELEHEEHESIHNYTQTDIAQMIYERLE